MSPETGQLLILGAVSASALANAATTYVLWRDGRGPEVRIIQLADAAGGRIRSALGRYGFGRQCEPEFLYKPAEFAARVYGDQSALGPDLDASSDRKVWLVACRCENGSRCPWFVAASKLSFQLSIAVDRHLVRLALCEDVMADGSDRHRYATRVYHLTPEALAAGPSAFVEAASKPDAASFPPVAADGVEHTEAGAEQRDSEGQPVGPFHDAEDKANARLARSYRLLSSAITDDPELAESYSELAAHLESKTRRSAEQQA